MLRRSSWMNHTRQTCQGGTRGEGKRDVRVKARQSHRESKKPSRGSKKSPFMNRLESPVAGRVSDLRTKTAGKVETLKYIERKGKKPDVRQRGIRDPSSGTVSRKAHAVAILAEARFRGSVFMEEFLKTLWNLLFRGGTLQLKSNVEEKEGGSRNYGRAAAAERAYTWVEKVSLDRARSSGKTPGGGASEYHAGKRVSR